MRFSNRMELADWHQFLAILAADRTRRTGGKLYLYGVLGAMIGLMAAGPVSLQVFPGILQGRNFFELIGLLLGPLVLILLLSRLLLSNKNLQPELREEGAVLGQRSIELTPAGLRIINDKSETLLHWSAFESAILTDSMLILKLEPLVAYAFPRQHSTPREFDDFIAEVRHHAPQLADDLDGVKASANESDRKSRDFFPPGEMQRGS